MPEPASTPTPKTLAELSTQFDIMQLLREGMTSLISLVILVLAAVTLWQTFQSGGAAGIQVEAYNRQKDIMLYALALFGTVTGYYLGRAPAEVNAKRADAATLQAQAQLAKTQEKLTDTAATASVASAQLGQAKEEKNKIAKNLKETTGALRQAEGALAGALGSSANERPNVAGTDSESVVGDVEGRIREAREHIARVLARVEPED